MAGVSVTEVAFRYGYDSVEGLSRAFRSWYYVVPDGKLLAAETSRCLKKLPL